jgi:hypothetical protein
MSNLQPRLGDMQKRFVWFIFFIALVSLVAGVYLRNSIYMMIGLLGVGVIIGGLIRLLLERFRQRGSK